jgi:hypothetical protein
MDKPWEDVGKYGKTMGKPEKIWKNHGKTMEKPWISFDENK